MSFGGSSGSGSISGSSDVVLSGPTNNQVLTYDSSTSKWKNKTLTSVVPTNGVLYSTSPSSRPTTDATIVVIFICSTQPTAMIGNDVWLSELGV